MVVVVVEMDGRVARGGGGGPVALALPLPLGEVAFGAVAAAAAAALRGGMSAIKGCDKALC